MAARAIWKGSLKIGAESVPVKLYSAVQDVGVHFNILNAKTHQPVKQRMVNPDTGEEVPREEIQRAVELESGNFVIMTEEELATLTPEASRDIEITRFVKKDKINHQWFERPYFLGPDDSDLGYSSLIQALEDGEVEGVAKWVMRGKEYLGALRALNNSLMLVTLRHSDEVIAASQLPKPSGRALDKKEIDMATQLVEALNDEFKPEDYKDEYRERVMKLIEEKASGKKPKLQVIKAKKETSSLLDALSASLKAAGKKKGSAVA